MGKVIDADILIGEIEKMAEQIRAIRKDGFLTEQNVMSIIERQPSVDDWNPCEEKMPENIGWYQCTCYDRDIWGEKGLVRDLYYYPGIKQFVDNIRYHEHGCKDIEKFFWTKHVIAWKERPNPYDPKANLTNTEKGAPVLTNYESIRQKSIHEMEEWLHKYGEYEGTPWQKWWKENHCDKCETVTETCVDSGKEYDFCYCDLERKCRFYPEMEEEPSLKQVIRMWLEAEAENRFDT